MKHIKGPWTVDTSDPKIVTVRTTDKDHFIRYLVSNRPDYAEQQLANANLIAAAPELLEALEAIINTIVVMDREMEDSFSVRRCKKVIAKAKGGQL